MSVVELEQVAKVYGDVVAVDGVGLSVDRGEVVALLGPNGAGKSTLFELLLGLVRPTAGRARVLGVSPGGEARAQVGAMLQHAGLPDQVTVAELVRLVGRSYPATLGLDAVLERVGLAHRHRHTVSTLSGGERQRLLLALAIVGDPQLLLLDEPTAAMDLEARRRFWEHTLASVDDGTTLVFATHDLAEADAVADRVVLLHHGQVLADATPTALKRLVPGCVVTLVTDAPPEVIARWPGVERVDPAPDGGSSPPAHARLAVSATDAESVVVPLVRSGHDLSGLGVAEADLETAFVQLTRSATAGATHPTLEGT